jgi:hypothetical protein
MPGRSRLPTAGSEKRQRRNRQKGGPIERCPRRSNGDFGVDGPQLRWEARSGEWSRSLWLVPTPQGGGDPPDWEFPSPAQPDLRTGLWVMPGD